MSLSFDRQANDGQHMSMTNVAIDLARQFWNVYGFDDTAIDRSIFSLQYLESLVILQSTYYFGLDTSVLHFIFFPTRMEMKLQRK